MPIDRERHHRPQAGQRNQRPTRNLKHACRVVTQPSPQQPTLRPSQLCRGAPCSHQRTWAEYVFFDCFQLRHKAIVGLPPRFPVEIRGVDGLHAALSKESRTRGPCFQREVGNLGSPIFFGPCTPVRTWGTPTELFRPVWTDLSMRNRWRLDPLPRSGSTDSWTRANLQAGPPGHA
jgi:hypothetical protein